MPPPESPFPEKSGNSTCSAMIFKCGCEAERVPDATRWYTPDPGMEFKSAPRTTGVDGPYFFANAAAEDRTV